MSNLAEPIRWLGETVGFWIQTGIFAVSAIGGIWIIRARGNQEKRRATVDLVLDQRRDEGLLEARHVILKIHDSGETNLAKYLEKPDSEQYKAIVRVLNMHEFVASGLRQGAFDEMTYKRLRFSTVRRDWDALCGFIMEIRRSKSIQTLFQEFQWLNNRWQSKPLKADNPQALTL